MRTVEKDVCMVVCEIELVFVFGNEPVVVFQIELVFVLQNEPPAFLGQKQDANRLTSPGTTPAFELSWMRCYDMSLDQTLDSDGP